MLIVFRSSKIPGAPRGTLATLAPPPRGGSGGRAATRGPPEIPQDPDGRRFPSGISSELRLECEPPGRTPALHAVFVGPNLTHTTARSNLERAPTDATRRTRVTEFAVPRAEKARMERNRVSAARHRQSQRDLIESLKQQLAAVQTENDRLKQGMMPDGYTLVKIEPAVFF